MLIVFFWLFLALALYSYFIYPALLWLMGLSRPSHAIATRPESTLPMTIVITAFNEEGRIREKLENTLAIDHPSLEVIVASDCSTDRTEEIVKGYSDRGVRLVRATERLGKENAQRLAIREASGSVIVFSDVATHIPPDALQRMSLYFGDASVGAVSSEDRFVAQEGATVGEGAYVRYEMWLRRRESQLAGLVGLSGSFFAARAQVCQEWDIHSPSDFNTAINSARLGLRAVNAPDVLGFYRDLQDPSKEYQRKVRTVLRGITAISRHPSVLNPLRFGLFAWQVWSHKVMRWAVPWLLLGVFFLNLTLMDTHFVYQLLLVGQLAFYGTAILAHASRPFRTILLVRIVYFFVRVNIAVADAFWQFISGKRMSTWQPSTR